MDNSIHRLSVPFLEKCHSTQNDEYKPVIIILSQLSRPGVFIRYDHMVLNLMDSIHYLNLRGFECATAGEWCLEEQSRSIRLMME